MLKDRKLKFLQVTKPGETGLNQVKQSSFSKFYQLFCIVRVMSVTSSFSWWKTPSVLGGPGGPIGHRPRSSLNKTQTLVLPLQALVLPMQALVLPMQSLVLPLQSLVLPMQALVLPLQSLVLPPPLLPPLLLPPANCCGMRGPGPGEGGRTGREGTMVMWGLGEAGREGGSQGDVGQLSQLQRSKRSQTLQTSRCKFSVAVFVAK